MSDVSFFDLGRPLSPVPIHPSVNPELLAELAHNLAVRIACHMVRDRRSEGLAYLEVTTCMNDTQAMPPRENAIDTSSDDGAHRFERSMSGFAWDRALILGWVSIP